jgi:hypothetical protein
MYKLQRPMPGLSASQRSRRKTLSHRHKMNLQGFFNCSTTTKEGDGAKPLVSLSLGKGVFVNQNNAS